MAYGLKHAVRHNFINNNSSQINTIFPVPFLTQR